MKPILRLLPLFLLLIAGLAHASPDLEATRAAVAAEPDRPGLHIALAEQLLAVGDDEGAEAEARGVLARWPSSSRAKLILARVARLRGNHREAGRLLADVELHGAQQVREEAARMRDRPISTGRWLAWGTLGGQYDSRALSVGTVDILPPVLGEEPAFRALASAGGGYRSGRLGFRLGVERSVHLPARSTQSGGFDVGDLDRTSLWLEGRTELGRGDNRFDVALLGRGALAGREAEPSYGGGGLGLGWRMAGAAVRPWARARGLGLALADADPLVWVEGEAGADVALGPLDMDVSTSAAWLGPDVVGGREAAADLQLALAGTTLRPFVGGGVGVRDDDRGVRPRAVAGLRFTAGPHAALVAEGGWQQIEQHNRFLAGLGLEVWR